MKQQVTEVYVLIHLDQWTGPQQMAKKAHGRSYPDEQDYRVTGYRTEKERSIQKEEYGHVRNAIFSAEIIS